MELFGKHCGGHEKILAVAEKWVTKSRELGVREKEILMNRGKIVHNIRRNTRKATPGRKRGGTSLV